MTRLCFALDLVDEAASVAEYERWHTKGAVWPEVIADIYAQGILDMEIWRTGNRLFMIVSAANDYPHPRQPHPKIADWEDLMWTFQQALPKAETSEKWVPMARIFALADHKIAL